MKKINNFRSVRTFSRAAGISLFVIVSVYACKPKKAVVSAEPAPVPPAVVTVPKAPSACDTTSYTFTKDIKPIMVNHCVKCHGNFARYEDVKHESKRPSFIGSMRHEEPYHPMPKNRPKLSDSTLRVISCWIEKGSVL
jgi:hypothetical protein